jgi:hypothetical protein
MGPLRSLWEGGSRGEAFLRFLKAEIKSGLGGRWQEWALRNLYEMKAFYAIESSSSSEYSTRSKFYEYRTNESEAKIVSQLQRRKPMSGVRRVSDGKLFFVYRQLYKTYLYPVEFQILFKSLNGIVYVSLNLSQERIEVDEIVGVVGVNVLPKLGEKGIPSVNDKGVRLFTVITSEWYFLGKQESPHFIKVGQIKPSVLT